MKIKYKPWAKGLMYLVEAVVIILSVFPILWVVMSSFKTNGEILSSPLALPAHFSLDTFIEIFQKYSFPTYFFNSLLAAGVSTLVSLLFYAMGAYVIAKFEFPGRKLLFALFTITLLVPSLSKTQPIFSLIMKLNLYDSIWGVTLVYLSAGMAMSIFVLKAGFMAIPKSLDEADTGRRKLLPHVLDHQPAAGIKRTGDCRHPDVPRQLERVLLCLAADRFGLAAHTAHRAGILHQRIFLQLHPAVCRAYHCHSARHHPVCACTGSGAGQRCRFRFQGLMERKPDYEI